MLKVIPLIISFLAPGLTGFLLAMAFPNHPLDWLAWLAFVPLLLAIRGKRPWQAFLMGWFGGVVFFIGITPWWIKEFQFVNPLASGLGYLYLSLYFAFFCFFLSLLLRHLKSLLLVAPPLWVAFEYLRSNLFFLAFPWGLLGHTQYLNLPIIQMASFTGVYGVSFVIMLVNAALAHVIILFFSSSPSRGEGEKRYFKGFLNLGLKKTLFTKEAYRLVAVLLIVTGLWAVGWAVVPSLPVGKPISVAVVQGNIPQKMKWNREYRERIISKYETLTEAAAKFEPKLIVWPEASTPGFVLNDLSLLRRINSLTSRVKANLLVGSVEYPKFSKPLLKRKLDRGNTALFFSPHGRVLGQYLKIRLVPFGEYIPYKNIIPWPDFIVRKEKRSFDIPGTEATLFRVDGNQFGTLICWEVLFPDLSRNLTKNGAGFAINMTNEAWFGKLAFPYQMLSSCVFRAVENRINLVRCANTGISCFIDPWGRVTSRVIKNGQDSFVEGTLTQTIYLNRPGTFYTYFGDILVYLSISFTVFMLIYSWFKRNNFNSRAT